MKILVAGGAGFIGSHLCEKLLMEGHEVICVDNLITGSEKNVNHFKKDKKFILLKHDVTLPLAQNMHADAVFHLASPASPNHHSLLSYHNLPMETMLVNTIGTLELLKFVMQNEAKFLFASSSEVYGDPLEHPQKETYFGNVSAVGPRSVYDEAKRFGETITFHFFRKYKIDIRIARIFNTYGPKMLKDDMRMIITFILEALQGRPITVFGDGQQTRSLCYVDDMIDGLNRLMFLPNTRGEIINLGSTNEHTVLEYAEMIKKITKSKSLIVFSEKLPQDDPKKRKPDITQAQKILDWQPHIKLEEGLGKMIDYCKKNIL
ncbi:NAD-dependent dehydratase [Candidatus Roizmanbacteria bacterium RIFCSPHIGHO2_01_FULL_39_8]|uniref:NAD-dependent dehydratase n=2 Tax=Candidatus Roizmaniibacteriota TaxID=1752723 RepID=A0A1F7GGA3_9BACT|nr:MAG: NAD-dependent dehydratase [Candidatus Roizmanbacteria bacterium RIFCSPHIGHO2_01_FULL_39_8]OGK28139.1 MAG: NAD-dependent dehydratase [Candidatus Roizmanbacteria bacterium RIFCSPHIGHO2_02_FULL_39_9]